MAGNLPIPNKGISNTQELSSSFASGFLASSPLVQAVIARDVADCSDDDIDLNTAVDLESESDGDIEHEPTLYRRPSGIAFGTARPALMAPHLLEEPILTPVERHISRNAERSLLRDNHILPPKHPLPEHESLFRSVYKRLFSTKIRLPKEDEETAPAILIQEPTETTALLGESAYHDGGAAHGHHLNDQWNAAVAAGQIKTTWQREAMTIAGYSRNLIVTFLLQYSITVTSVIAVGHIGSLELGAVTLAHVTANITCFAPIQGLATCLDTLCAQAYGSGHKHLVGLQWQRMSWFLLLTIVPISVLWMFSEHILSAILPEPASAAIAARYLHIIIAGTPAYAVFEGGKRFVQAQGLFQATTYVLLIAAPFNMVMQWLLVWKLEMGFIGAPIAVCMTHWLLPILLLLYVWKIDGSQCWGGFSWKAFDNWGPMIRLAVPGMVMVMAEWLCFEILTLSSSQFGTAYLAAQSVIVTVSATTYQIPAPMGIAGATRTANLIGAKLIDAAKISSKVTTVFGILIGTGNMILLWIFRYQIPSLFTEDPEVIEMVAHVLPVVAVLQFCDGLTSASHGLLRGIGRQRWGGPVNLVCWYLVALPISLFTGFYLDWKLWGFWFGSATGLAVVSTVENVLIYNSDWEEVAKEAEHRNASG